MKLNNNNSFIRYVRVPNFTNYNIKHLLENLELQMKRYEQSTALGMWDFAAYVLSDDIKEVDFRLGSLSDDERKIILDGCLINFYKN